MTLRICKLNLSFDYFSVALLCACVVLLGERALAAILCAFIHESGHIAALLYFGSENIDITLRMLGAEITDKRQHTRSDFQIIVIAACGPLANLLTIPIFHAARAMTGADFLGACTGISAAIAVFNLLPAESTDGGMIVQTLARQLFGERAADILIGVLTVVFLTPVCAAAFFVLLRSKNNFTMLFAVISIIVSMVQNCDRPKLQIPDSEFSAL